MVRPIKILQVVGGMGRGGTETWLMQVLKNIDRERFHMDFLVHTTEKREYDDEIQSLGSKVLPCRVPSRPLTYAKNFYRTVHDFGPYDVIHSHVHCYSGYVLRLARRAGIPVRIAHSHSDTSQEWATSGRFRRMYLTNMRSWIHRYATDGLSASSKAAAALFGPDWESDSRWKLLYCGIDLAPFRNRVDKVSVREEWGIPPNGSVVGHVGNFRTPKNHAFLVEVAKEVSRQNANVYFVLIGDGPLRASIEQKVAEYGLGNRVIFAGQRADAPRLMLGAMDAFVLPSIYEGLPLVLLEAQAAGLPCVVSTTVTEEADCAKSLIRRLSLSEPASVWADELLDVLNGASRSRDNSLALTKLEESPFNIVNSTKNIEALYWTRYRELCGWFT